MTDMQTLAQEVNKLQDSMREVQAQMAGHRSGLKDFAAQFAELTARVNYTVNRLEDAVDKCNGRIDKLEHQHVVETRKRLDQLDEHVALLNNSLEYFRKRVCAVEDNAEQQSDWYREQFQNRIVAAEDARSTLSEAVAQLREQVGYKRVTKDADQLSSELVAAMRAYFDWQEGEHWVSLSGSRLPWCMPAMCMDMLREKGFAVEKED